MNPLTLPNELLEHILSFIPADKNHWELVCKQLHTISRSDSFKKIYFDHLKNAFVRKGLTEERFKTHIHIVQTRLTKRGNEESIQSLVQELIAFQGERFPPNPFSSSLKPNSIDNFIERESIIKEYNQYLVAKKMMPTAEAAENIEDLISLNRNFFWGGYRVIEQVKLDCDYSNLTEIPEIISVGANLSTVEIFFSRNRISYIPNRSFQGIMKLKSLWLDKNQITSIDSLTKLINLESLYLSHNQISSIDPIAKLKDLHTLILNDNQISSIDSLVHLRYLQALDLSDNQISSIDPIAKLKCLYTLILNDNQISSIDSLAHLTKLQFLHLSGNQIRSIDSLAGLRKLENLHLSKNKISSIAPIAKLTNLEVLKLKGNQISSIDPIANLIGLEELTLKDNKITNLEPLNGFIDHNVSIDILTRALVKNLS